MHTITCSFQAEEQWKKHLFFAFFTGLDRGWAERLQIFLGIFQGIFFIEKGGFSIYKYLRNQGRKRCKTNVNFQFIVNFFYIVSCRMEQFMKKRLNLFLLLLNTVEEKRGRGLPLGWATPLTFFSFFLHFYFLWPNCFVLCLNELIVCLFS